MAMKFNLEELNPGTFFPFDEEESPDDGVDVRVLSRGKLQEISKLTQVKKSEVKGSPPTRFEYLEYKDGGEEKEFELTWDYCIMSWKGVVDHNGNEIPCTKENKVKLMKGSARFARFITLCLRKLNDSLAAEEKEKEKNSSST